MGLNVYTLPEAGESHQTNVMDFYLSNRETMTQSIRHLMF